ncbi:MAG: ComF family protein [Crocosphaera sp.]
MEIQNKSLIKEQKVILLDDVLTTGNTVKACQELLLEAGAKEVKIIVLGKTIRDLDYYYHLLESQYPIFINKIYKEIDKERDRKWKELHNSYQIKHQEIDEWADNEHQELNYFDPDDDYGHDCIDQQAKEKYNCLNYEEENKASYIDQEAETIKAGEYENYSHLKDEIYDAINGCSCLSPSNPFLTLFLN